MAATGRPAPVSLTAHYLSPGQPGRLDIDTTVIREGRRFATATATLSAAGRPVLTALGTFGEPGGGPGNIEVASWVDGGPPAFWYGALMQWLNPKAWLAASMGMGAYGVAGGVGQIVLFTALYLVICLGSIACWAYAGSRLQGWLVSPRRLRGFNRAMALLLLLSAVYLVRSS